MTERDEYRSTGIAQGALVARIAGSIVLAIGAAGVIVSSVDVEIGPRPALAMRAAAASVVSAGIILLIVRCINWLARRRRH